MDFSKIHPFQIVFIAVFAILAFVGLFMFANFSGFGGGKAVVGNVTIWGTLPADQMQDGVRDLISAHKEYGSVRYVAKPAETFETDLAEAIASGTGPDLIVITQEQLLSQLNKITLIPFKSIPERTYKDSYVPIFNNFLTGEGTYGVPFVVDPLVLYYNRTMLESAGIAEPPSTWEAVTGLSALLTRKLPDQTLQKSLVAFGEYENVTNARALVSLLLLQSGAPITTSTNTGVRAALATAPTAGSFGTTPAESALNFYTQFANPTKTVYSWNRSMQPARQAFLAGDVALYPGFASERALLSAGNPNLNFDMSRMPQPETSDKRVTYGLGYVFAIPKASKNTSGAFQTAMAIAGKDVAPSFAGYLGMAPALRGSLKAPADDAYGPVFFPEALVASGWLSPAPKTIDTIFSTMIGNITTGRKSVRDALFTADQALDAAL